MVAWNSGEELQILDIFSGQRKQDLLRRLAKDD